MKDRKKVVQPAVGGIVNAAEGEKEVEEENKNDEDEDQIPPEIVAHDFISRK